MQLDALALRMRPRAPLEAADLGARLCQAAARSVYACYAVAYVPIAALALSVSIMVSMSSTSEPPSINPRTCSANASFI